MDKYKDIFLNRHLIPSAILDFSNINKLNLKIKEFVDSENKAVIYNGNDKFAHIYYKNNDAVTLYCVGEFKKIHEAFFAYIYDKCYIDKPNNKIITFCVDKKIFDSYYEDNKDYCTIKDDIDKNTVTIIFEKKVRYEYFTLKSKIVITYYITTKKMNIQGKSSEDYCNAVNFFVQKNKNILNDISLNDDFSPYLKNISYEKIFGIRNDLITMVKTSFVTASLLNERIEIDFSIILFPILKSIEGLIKFRFGIKNESIGGMYDFGEYFDPNTKKIYNKYENLFDHEEQQFLNDFYLYFNKYRNKYFHTEARTIKDKLIESYSDAIKILIEGIHILRKYGSI